MSSFQIVCLSLLVSLTACGSGDGASGNDGGETSNGGDDAGGGDAGGGPTADAGPVVVNDAGEISCGASAGGTGTFARKPIANDHEHGQAMHVGDMDGDGLSDVVVPFSLSDDVYLYHNNCGSWQEVEIAPPNTLVATAVTAADFDSDGHVDVAVAELFARNGASGSVRWYKNPGDLSSPWTEQNITGPTVEGPRSLQSADLSGDGLPDLVLGTSTFGDGILWFRNTGGAFTGPLPIDTSVDNIHSLRVHDVDGDGVLDVVTASNADDELSWYESDRTAGQSVTSIAFTKHVIEGIKPYGLAFGNFDADPALELVVSNARGVDIYDPPANPLTGSWTVSSLTTDFAGETSVFLEVADLNGDGDDDIALIAGNSSVVRVYLRTGSTFAEVQVDNAYVGPNSLGVGDLDGDGDTDLATATFENGGDTELINWWENLP